MESAKINRVKIDFFEELLRLWMCQVAWCEWP